MSKDMYISAHEDLIEEFMEEHPNVTYEYALEATSDAAMDRMSDNYADMCDRAYDVAMGK